MQTLTLDQLRTAAKAGGISTVTLQAQGNAFYLHILTKSGAETVLSRARSTEPRAFANPMLAIRLLSKIGIFIGTFDLSQWEPGKAGGTRKRPDRAEAMAQANAALDYDKWFREQVAMDLAEADDPNTKWVTEEEAELDWARKRAELMKRIKGNAA